MNILINNIDIEHIDVTTIDSNTLEFLMAYCRIDYKLFIGKDELCGTLRIDDVKDIINFNKIEELIRKSIKDIKKL
jgi:hypothetical protein